MAEADKPDKPDKFLKVQPIRDGTVIDHITPGKALLVLEMLGLSHSKPEGATISLLSRVPSHTGGRKDIVKVEQRELTKEELQLVALICPGATINIIHDSRVSEKFRVELPDTVEGLLGCPNPNCITNQHEPLPSRFEVESDSPLRLICYYCERAVEDVEAQLV